MKTNKIFGLKMFDLKKIVFIFITFMVVGATLIDSMAKISFIVFIFGFVYLWFQYRKIKINPLFKLEKGWIVVSLIYASVFLLSFLLRYPYTDDGLWRISSPLFILLFSGWFYLVVRSGFVKTAVKVVAFSIVLFGLLVLIADILVHSPNILSSSYRLGDYYSDYGATGFILPIGAALSFVMLVSTSNKKFWWLLSFIGLVIVLLVKKRTPLIMYIFTLLGFVGWSFFHARFLEVKKKIVILIVVFLVIAASVWVQKDMIKDAIDNYHQAKNNDNLETSLGLRYQMFNIGVYLIKQKPLFGWGLNDYKKDGLWPYVDNMKFSASGKELLKGFTHLHNQYLMDWVISGVFGLIALLIFVLYPLFVFIKWLKVDPLQAWISIGMMCGIYFVMFFGALFTYTYTTIIYMLAVSSLISWSSYRINRISS